MQFVSQGVRWIEELKSEHQTLDAGGRRIIRGGLGR